MWFDHWVAAILVPVAVWILLSGLDDLFIDFVFFFRKRREFVFPAETELAHAPQRRIAILLPLWHEHAVIEQMLRHNLSVVRYGNYDIFVGVYPNDPLTMEAVKRVECDDARVHSAVCPHDGPTSKGDCLNATYRRMLEYEARHGIDFEILMTHDAEDLIHPESLRLINWFSRDHQMVQIPVLPLATGLDEWTHGLYCDEFAEFQLKDIPVRQQLRGFLPSTGVGTGFERSALEDLRRRHNGKLFDPECLTEDYENGFRMHAAGYHQTFVPIHFQAQQPVATREYFPKQWRAAIRQRSRWIAGIALQGWQHHGWRAPAWQRYWFWRDRKGLVGNLISPLANVLFFYWLVCCGAAAEHIPWRFAALMPASLWPMCLIATWISLLQAGVRMHLSARVYGWRFAAGVPLRVVWGNIINCAATAEAVRQFLAARVRRKELAWRKTEHVYPGAPVHIHTRPRLGEVLVRLRLVSMTELEDALRLKAPGQRLGEYLTAIHRITQENLEQALSSQAGQPVEAWTAEFSDSRFPAGGNRNSESLLPEHSHHPSSPV
ncbi:MAG: hypothetical protein C5B51_25475 [Terriglobia bacterium]|nr:MAG: hypothetical protein C5B51_25475 [Terriglobia bacterium]